MIRAFLSAFCAEWRKSRAVVSASDEAYARMVAEADQIEARCEARRASIVGLDPGVVAQWVSYLEDHSNVVLIVGRPDLAVVVSAPRPYRVH